jgi:peroxiredoxin
VTLDPGNPLPKFELRDETGRIARRPRRKTLYGFFKTTCPTCALAWPYLDRIRRLAEGGALSVLAVSQDDPKTTKDFNDRLGVAVRTLYDPEPWRASEALGLAGVPTFLLVDRRGVLRDSAVGFQKHKMEEFAGRAAGSSGRRAPALYSPDEKVPSIKPG